MIRKSRDYSSFKLNIKKKIRLNTSDNEDIHLISKTKESIQNKTNFKISKEIIMRKMNKQLELTLSVL